MGALKLPPKGWLAIRVGEEGREQRRFLVPVRYLSHPLFIELLKESEEEYGFQQKGAIRIPCEIEYFLHVKEVIDRDNSCRASETASAAHYLHRPIDLICFRAIS
ncbi:hypothetical protein KFK09_000040 [Dendrobium nobile]|uniref:Small auxin up regulated protein n=1 Tax=Dendrobium nobile TaxID=94219 RepID=A0A8T3C9Z9_DENNO|nr:hypothetical protein KFK09_000040 [Dendrobium nobile]